MYRSTYVHVKYVYLYVHIFTIGFCGETEEEHKDSVRLMEEVKYDQAFMFAYSLREKTHAAHTMEDDVPPEIKSRRLQEIITTFRTNVVKKNEERETGALKLVLVEGLSSKATAENPTLTGRSDGNQRVVFNNILPINDNSLGQFDCNNTIFDDRLMSRTQVESYLRSTTQNSALSGLSGCGSGLSGVAGSGSAPSNSTHNSKTDSSYSNNHYIDGDVNLTSPPVQSIQDNDSENNSKVEGVNVYKNLEGKYVVVKIFEVCIHIPLLIFSYFHIYINICLYLFTIILHIYIYIYINTGKQYNSARSGIGRM
jgi:hypothetical protein